MAELSEEKKWSLQELFEATRTRRGIDGDEEDDDDGWDMELGPYID